MTIGNYRSEILQALQVSRKTPLRDADQAWAAVQHCCANISPTPNPKSLTEFVYSLALIFAFQTGLTPGFSNSDNETRFERFAMSVAKQCVRSVTLNQIKYAVRKIDPKNNAGFEADLDALLAGHSGIPVRCGEHASTGS